MGSFGPLQSNKFDSYIGLKCLAGFNASCRQVKIVLLNVIGV